jgi:hypothetical protein
MNCIAKFKDVPQSSDLAIWRFRQYVAPEFQNLPNSWKLLGSQALALAVLNTSSIKHLVDPEELSVENTSGSFRTKPTKISFPRKESHVTKQTRGRVLAVPVGALLSRDFIHLETLKSYCYRQEFGYSSECGEALRSSDPEGGVRGWIKEW